jgi:hypothetical protein
MNEENMKLSCLFVCLLAISVIIFVADKAVSVAATSISSCVELQNIKNDLSGIYYLTSDNDCTDTLTWNGGAGFEPIGTNTTPFTGTLDGKHHAITNLYINRPDPWPNDVDVGLFGFIDDGCIIKNLGMINVDITGASSAGALVAITGLIADIYISNCHVSGIVSGGYGVGGLVGYNRGGNISHSYSTAAVFGDGDIYDYTGGFVGINNHGGEVALCFSTGNVTASGSRSGGFVGSNTGRIRECFAIGNVNGGHSVGGFVGENDSTTVNGHFAGSIRNSYAIGNVSGTDWVGGFAGINWGVQSLTSVIENCYSAGIVTGSTNTGGFVGRIGDLYEINNCYWDTLTSGQSSSAGGYGKTTAEMRQQATYNSWNFNSIWGITESVNYPYLVQPRKIHNMISFVYNTDVAGASAFKTLLQGRGYLVIFVPKSSVVDHNFGQYQLVIISSDTGFGYDWGTNDQVEAISSVDVPILGLGFGGGTLFQEMGVSISFGNGWITDGSSIYVSNPRHCVFSKPNSISISNIKIEQPYTYSEFMAVYEPVLDPAVILFGRQENDDSHWILVQEGKDFLWGFTADPSDMTQPGKNLFHNLVNYLTDGCSPKAMPCVPLLLLKD